VSDIFDRAYRLCANATLADTSLVRNEACSIVYLATMRIRMKVLLMNSVCASQEHFNISRFKEVAVTDVR
jgi:hypothetical protein